MVLDEYFGDVLWDIFEMFYGGIFWRYNIELYHGVIIRRDILIGLTHCKHKKLFVSPSIELRHDIYAETGKRFASAVNSESLLEMLI